MATYFSQESRTFSEYLLVPNRTGKECIPSRVNLRTPVARFKKGREDSSLYINLPVVSAIMQAVSHDGMAIALARLGGLSFIYASQPIDQQADMIRKVKKFKAGVVTSDSNVTPDATLEELLALKEKTGHSTVAVTEDGRPDGRLVGIVTSKDYRITRTPLDATVSSFMTPYDKLVVGQDGITLSEANDLIWDHKVNQLPIVNENRELVGMVFRKDYDEHKENPTELLDANKRLMVGAGINTRDYRERVPALLDAGADILCIDSSDGFSDWQAETVRYIKETHGPDVLVGGGNVVDKEGFEFLAEAGVDFVKVGIGGGSICITREQKGIGMGQATAVQNVARARDEYFARTGEYIPVCSDGGIVLDYHMALALAMGADFIMLGRYFARFDESPTRTLMVNGSYVKEYWGEGSNRARNWQRYAEGNNTGLSFEEGVDSYVPYAGSLRDNLEASMSKIRSTMCSCGALSVEEMQQKSRMILVSSTSIVEGGAHDVITKDSEIRS